MPQMVAHVQCGQLLGVANIKSFLDSIIESWVVFVGEHMNKWVQQRGNAPSPYY